MSFSKREKINNIFIFGWLFVMMVVPEVSTIIKILFLFGLFFLVLIHYTSFVINRRILLGIIIWEMFFSVFLINGLKNGFEFSITLFEIYLIRPVVLVILCTAVRDKKDFLLLAEILIVLTICIGIYNFIYMMGNLGLLPRIITEKNAIIIVENHFLSIRTNSQIALMFLAPFITTLYFGKRKFKREIGKLITLGFYFCALVTLLSGRRVLQIIFLTFLGVNYIRDIIMAKNIDRVRKRIFYIFILLLGVISICIILFKISGINIVNAIWHTITNAFDLQTKSSIIRMTQMKYLFAAWVKKPIIGWGLSAYVKEYIDWKYMYTGILQKDWWSYENFYVALLFQIGAVGIILISIVVTVMLKNIIGLYKKNRDNEIGTVFIAILFGVIGFLISGATNPMVTSIWMWFIFMGTYNYSLKNNVDKRNYGYE